MDLVDQLQQTNHSQGGFLCDLCLCVWVCVCGRGAEGLMNISFIRTKAD